VEYTGETLHSESLRPVTICMPVKTDLPGHLLIGLPRVRPSSLLTM